MPRTMPRTMAASPAPRSDVRIHIVVPLYSQVVFISHPARRKCVTLRCFEKRLSGAHAQVVTHTAFFPRLVFKHDTRSVLVLQRCVRRKSSRDMYLQSRAVVLCATAGPSQFLVRAHRVRVSDVDSVCESQGLLVALADDEHARRGPCDELESAGAVEPSAVGVTMRCPFPPRTVVTAVALIVLTILLRKQACQTLDLSYTPSTAVS